MKDDKSASATAENMKEHVENEDQRRNSSDHEGGEQETAGVEVEGERGHQIECPDPAAGDQLLGGTNLNPEIVECPDQNHGDIRFQANSEIYPNSYVQFKKSSPKKSGSSLHKYRNAMYHFLPVRKDRKENECPFESAGFFSTITFHWIQKLMMRIYHKGLEDEDIWTCPKEKNAETNCRRLEGIWNEELKKKGDSASFGRAMFRFVRRRILVAALELAIHVLISFVGPAYFLRSILEYTQHDEINLAYGIGLAIGLSVVELARSLSAAISFSMNYQTGIQLRGAVLALAYEKVLRLRSMKNKSAGQLVNLFSSDAHRIFDVCINGYNIISGPIISLVALIYLLFLLGPIVIVGFAVLFCFYPFQLCMSKLTSLYRRKAVAITDRRVRLMNEILTCVKLIKMYAWEKPFAKTIEEIRESERKVLEKSTYVHSMTMAFTPGLPITAAIVTLIAHTLLGNDLTAAQAFTLVSVFNCVRPKISVAPAAVKSLIEASIAAGRYQEILMMEESTPVPKPDGDTYDIVFTASTLAWDVPPYAKEEKVPEISMKDKRFLSESEDIPTATPRSEAKLPHGKTQVKLSKKVKDVETGEKINAKPKERKCLLIKKNPKSSQIEMERSSEEGEDLEQCFENDEEFEDALFDIDLSIKKGSLIGICGSVGSGKSSLLAAVLGQMKLKSGSVAVNGKVAYVAQQAWIINATVKENITFGYPWNEARYKSVVEACKLLTDFDSFPCGDDTEVGERGINLSGGQKQRVSLARAIYSDRDIFLLDDPLSAVDSHVGHHMFNHCIKTLLKEKTVLLVMHQLQYLHQCDEVVFIKDGRIVERGRHEDLMEHGREYTTMVNHYHSEEKLRCSSTEGLHHAKSLDLISMNNQPDLWNPNRELLKLRRPSLSVPDLHLSSDLNLINSSHSIASILSADSADVEGTPGKLIEAEARARGKISWTVYWSYTKAAGGLLVCFLVLFVFFINIACSGLGNWWLSYWLSHGSGNTSVTVDNVTYISDKITDNPRMYFFNSIHGAILVAILLTTCVRSLLIMKCTLHAASVLHDQLFIKVLRSPMSFFDSTPTGRILNRFAKDLDDVDVGLPMLIESVLQNIFLIVLCLFMIVYVFPWFSIAVIPLAVLFYFIQAIFRAGLRELKRLDSVTRSPLYSYITASIQGLHTIKAYEKNQEYISTFKHLLDKNTMPLFLHHCAKRWLTIRLDLVAITIILITALLVVLLKDEIPTAYAGLALSFAIMLIGLIQYTLRMAFSTETIFTAVERIEEYTTHLKSEAPPIIKDKRPPKLWPSEGHVVFENVRMKYRSGLPYVLRGINLEIMPEEKVGIVGRTGSGKSSLGVVLFRLVELSGGSITIDDVDISEIGVEDLRSCLAIIPQDPVLFVGTIRYNLDPFSQHSDIEIWAALRKCHIIEMIRALPGRLDSAVVENGENFSVGERQLICLARALLRQSKILMLDEATASIDAETDSCIQKTIAESFCNCTILTIAHRLNTVLNYDRILVMKNGKVVEFDKPSVLLSRSNSAFSGMMAAVDSQYSIITSQLKLNFQDR